MKKPEEENFENLFMSISQIVKNIFGYIFNIFNGY
jgi:hypothetical protein